MGVRLLSKTGESLLRRLASLQDVRLGMTWTPSQVGVSSRQQRQALFHLISRGLVEISEGTGRLRLCKLTLRGIEVIRLAWPPEGKP